MAVASYLDVEKKAEDGAADGEEVSPVEEVQLTVATTDDPSLPVWTFRMWFLGLFSCALMSFLNQFFAYRTEPLIITQISVQVASLPAGHFLARVLPATKFRLPGFGDRLFSLNAGPFNMKEHVLISIFANAGYAFGSGSAYGVGIVNIIKAFYKRNISFLAGWILIITTQVLRNPHHPSRIYPSPFPLCPSKRRTSSQVGGTRTDPTISILIAFGLSCKLRFQENESSLTFRTNLHRTSDLDAHHSPKTTPLCRNPQALDSSLLLSPSHRSSLVRCAAVNIALLGRIDIAGVCGESLATKAHALTDPIDIFTDWLSKCMHVNN